MRFSLANRAGIWLALALTLVGCGGAKSSDPSVAPDFKLKSTSGQSLTLSSLRGHPVLLDFWATWCGPCQISTPIVQQFYDRHKKDGLQVVGVNLDEDPSDVYAFTKHFGITYPVVYGGNSSVQSDFGVEGLPTFVFLDAQGRVVDSFNGFHPLLVDTWEKLFQKTKRVS